MPNTVEQAKEKMEELLESDSPRENNPFFLNDCPFCKYPLLPERKSEIENECGFSVDAEGLSIRCRNRECLFHEQALPLHLVDDQIYRTLPTFVIGTIDKFASLPWKTEPGQMLTGRNGAATSPSLIIQDELHLISGPLGTLSGVYECAHRRIVFPIRVEAPLGGIDRNGETSPGTVLRPLRKKSPSIPTPGA